MKALACARVNRITFHVRYRISSCPTPKRSTIFTVRSALLVLNLTPFAQAAISRSSDKRRAAFVRVARNVENSPWSSSHSASSLELRALRIKDVNPRHRVGDHVDDCLGFVVDIAQRIAKPFNKPAKPDGIPKPTNSSFRSAGRPNWTRPHHHPRSADCCLPPFMFMWMRSQRSRCPFDFMRGALVPCSARSMRQQL